MWQLTSVFPCVHTVRVCVFILTGEAKGYGSSYYNLAAAGARNTGG